jgi:hypothetical protein
LMLGCMQRTNLEKTASFGRGWARRARKKFSYLYLTEL